MNYISPKIWKEFQQALNDLKEDAKPSETLAKILEWMRKYPDMFNKLPFSQYSFNRYLDLDVQEYPVEYSIAAMDNGWLSYRGHDRKGIIKGVKVFWIQPKPYKQ